jgi:chromatin assembly factor 1 subunit A
MAPVRQSSMSQSRSRDSLRRTKNPELPLPPPPIVPGLHLKTRYPYYTVDQLITKANETGDGEEARRVYKAFEDKRLYWRKTLKFWEDSRPAYEGEGDLFVLLRAWQRVDIAFTFLGTWSKPSLTVGPRTPFAQDNALDYSIDEGIEWEAEDPAEVELSSTLDEDEEPETEDEDEMDDWMVGDDEIEFEEGAEGYTEDKQGAEKKDQRPIEDYYTEVGKAGAVSRNQRFARLVPFQKGPCIETRLGVVDPVMEKYKICMLNGKLRLEKFQQS